MAPHKVFWNKPEDANYMLWNKLPKKKSQPKFYQTYENGEKFKSLLQACAQIFGGGKCSISIFQSGNMVPAFFW